MYASVGAEVEVEVEVADETRKNVVEFPPVLPCPGVEEVSRSISTDKQEKKRGWMDWCWTVRCA